MTEQKERLKKLYALALRGVGGEKEQAQAILDKLLKKYAKEALTRAYKAYHALGGNDVATELYHDIMELPTEPHKEQTEKGGK